MTREYRPLASAPAGQRTVYTETLTSSATPTLPSGQLTGEPTGKETLGASNIQSLTRALTNDAGQVIETDAYFSLSGVTYAQATPQLGSASNDSSTGNYHRTRIDYDGRGRLKRMETASGTVTRTLYDARGLMTSTWVGTDDKDNDLALLRPSEPCGRACPLALTYSWYHDHQQVTTEGAADGLPRRQGAPYRNTGISTAAETTRAGAVVRLPRAQGVRAEGLSRGRAVAPRLPRPA